MHYSCFIMQLLINCLIYLFNSFLLQFSISVITDLRMIQTYIVKVVYVGIGKWNLKIINKGSKMKHWQYWPWINVLQLSPSCASVCLTWAAVRLSWSAVRLIVELLCAFIIKTELLSTYLHEKLCIFRYILAIFHTVWRLWVYKNNAINNIGVNHHTVWEKYSPEWQHVSHFPHKYTVRLHILVWCLILHDLHYESNYGFLRHFFLYVTNYLGSTWTIVYK